jgi:hypothetical protein
MDVMLARSLARWGAKSTENRDQLEEWLDEAILSIASGKGAAIQSTAGNGINVSFMSSGMTNAEWLNVLTLAIQYIDTPAVSKITGRVR